MDDSDFHDDHYTSLCSEKTLQSYKNGFFLNFAEQVLDLAGTDWLKGTFAKLKTDKDRIQILFTDPQIKNTIWETLSNVQCIYRKKDVEISKKKRQMGEVLMKQGLTKKALMLFCQSVLRAPYKDETHALAYALFHRAHCLLELGLISNSLSDLKLLQSLNPPDILRVEIFAALAQCYHALGDEKKSKVAVELAKKLGKDKITVSVMKRVMEKPEAVIPTVTEGLMEVTETNNMGRYMIAKKNIKTGDTLIVEEPYVACLVPEYFGSHCHHCFKTLLSPIGCKECSSIAFCSTSCCEIALRTYHRHECRILDLLIGSGMSILCHAALRTITQGENKDEAINQLCKHENRRDDSDMLKRTLMAAFLLRCLITAGYFGDNKGKNDFVLNEEKLKIGERLLRNVQILQFNAHEIYETKRTSDHKFRGTRTAYIAIALYPRTALLNHDCYPAVTRYFVGQNIVIKAIRPLAKGEMIAENYGPIFLKRTLSDRQRSLASRYWFKCLCQACQQDWPTLEKLENSYARLRCPNKNCNYLFLKPVKEKATCLGCRRKVDLKPVLEELRLCEKMYQMGLIEMDSQRPEKAIPIMCEALDRFHKIASAPHRETHLCQESLRTCMADTGNIVIVN